MITAARITRRADEDGISARTVERDYVLAHVMAALASKSPEHTEVELVFKGGTALRLCYLEDYRYSADLDFSLTVGTLAEAHEFLRSALSTVPTTIAELGLTADEPPRIAYRGPLGRERELKLDIATDELVLDIERRPLIRRWPDLPVDSKILVYSLREIAAEKLRCILQRLQCRDLLDLSVLLGHPGVDLQLAAEAFRRKAEHRGIDPASLRTRLPDRLDQYRARWENELSEHVVGDPPPFDQVERELTRLLRWAGLI